MTPLAGRQVARAVQGSAKTLHQPRGITPICANHRPHNQHRPSPASIRPPPITAQPPVLRFFSRLLERFHAEWEQRAAPSLLLLSSWAAKPTRDPVRPHAAVALGPGS